MKELIVILFLFHLANGIIKGEYKPPRQLPKEKKFIIQSGIDEHKVYINLTRKEKRKLKKLLTRKKSHTLQRL